MKLSLKIFLIGIIAILFIASIGAIASDKLNFSYSYLSIISFLIYASIAFITTRKVNKKTGIILATVLGFIDATIGWKISTLLGANTGSSSIEITPTIWILTAMFMSGVAALFGLFGSWLAVKMNKNSQP